MVKEKRIKMFVDLIANYKEVELNQQKLNTISKH